MKTFPLAPDSPEIHCNSGACRMRSRGLEPRLPGLVPDSYRWKSFAICSDGGLDTSHQGCFSNKVAEMNHTKLGIHSFAGLTDDVPALTGHLRRQNDEKNKSEQ